jgi:hypothetical protein
MPKQYNMSRKVLKVTYSSSQRYGGNPPLLTIDALLGLQDVELQKYIYSIGDVLTEYREIKVDTDEKLGYYQTQDDALQNQSGAFYRAYRITEWIVYNKKTKKVRKGNQINSTLRNLMNDYFKYPTIINQYVRHWSPTLLKGVIEGKVKSLNDVFDYHRSYVLKRRKGTIQNADIMRFIDMDCRDELAIVEDPENWVWDEEFMWLKNEVPGQMMKAKMFKINITNYKQKLDEYHRWFEKQSEKHAILRGLGNEEAEPEPMQESQF